MSDDDLHPDLELASAYLDGELDAVERARVEASPELMAQVNAYRRVQHLLADLPPASTVALESAVAGALAAFDAPPVVGPVRDVTAPNVVPLRRRTATRILGAAAAVLLVGVVGVTALNSRGSNDDDTATDAAVEELADTMSAAGGESLESSPAADDSSTTIAGINGPASAPPPVNDEQALLEVADEADPASQYDTDGGAPADTVAATGTEAPAATTAPVEAGTEREAADTFGCPLGPDEVYVTQVIWRGVLAAVVRNVDTGEVSAIDSSCTVLVTVTP